MRPFLLAALTGLLLTFSFPSVGHPLFAWIALAPLLTALCAANSITAFWLGLLTGVVHFAGTIYWIPSVMVNFGGLPVVAAWCVHFVFIFFLSSFIAVFAVSIAGLVKRFGPIGLMFAPAVWVTMELGRIHLFTGFPWLLLGYSQVPFLAIAQLASIVGVLGISILLVAVSCTVSYSVVARGNARGLPAIVMGAVFVLVLTFGAWRLERSVLVNKGTSLTVAAVQGNVSQDDKWDRTRRDAILMTYLRQTRDAAAAGAELIVWPEAATQFPLADDQRSQMIRSTARATSSHLLIGTTEIEFEEQTRYYNAAHMVGPSGATIGTYRKQHLVPFGEYVPLQDALFFVSPLVEAVGSFSAGRSAEALPFDDGLVSAAICYEIIYPGLIRELVLAGADLLTTITNDAWFGLTAAPHQHFQMARMRAIEQGRYLVRSANTGISGIVDPYGRVIDQSALFEEAVVVSEVRLLTDVTFYGRIGDMPAYLGLLVTVLGLASRRR